MTHAREITDMAGRQVVVPDQIRRIYAAQPYTHVLTYMLAPDMLIGHLSIINAPEKRFLRPEAADLPTLGGAPGSGPAVNMETVLAAKPDIVLMKGNAQSAVSRAAEKFTQIGLPVVFVDLEHIDDYPAGIEFFGRLISREDKAKSLAKHARKVLADVDRAVTSIPDAMRVRVFYAESADGLTTECVDSFHTDAIKRAGGVIVHQCLMKTHMGMEKVSLEQIIAYDPEVIISNDPQFEATVYVDPRWAGIKAVSERRVWTVPHTPFNWIDRPPSVMRVLGVQWLASMRVLGVQWLASRFYPKAYAINLRSELRAFHQLFMGIELGEEDLDKWLKL